MCVCVCVCVYEKEGGFHCFKSKKSFEMIAGDVAHAHIHMYAGKQLYMQNLT